VIAHALRIGDQLRALLRVHLAAGGIDQRIELFVADLAVL